MVETKLLPADRVVMVSGASRGIGASITSRLIADGFRLSLGVRDPGRTLAALGAVDPDRVCVSRFDALQPETAKSWLDATLSRFGAIDALVNNAGILRQVGFDGPDDGEAVLDELWAVNVKAPFRLTRLVLPHLGRCGHGRIVNIASTDGKRYRDRSVSVGYAMSKHALMAVGHAARFAGWDAGVRVTAVVPGAVDTDLIAGIPGVTPGPGRMSPDTVAHTVAFILSLPNNASVAELAVNSRLESTL